MTGVHGRNRLALIALVVAGLGSCREKAAAPVILPRPVAGPNHTATATFAGGCFWCVDAVFRDLNGVGSVEAGYSGGTEQHPTYEQICSGETGHAEAIRIRFDPKLITYDELLEVFWTTHDPTTKNRQGNDVGPQYRSVVFYHDEMQRKLAEAYKKKLDASGAYRAPIVTEIVPFTAFWKAEEYHQDYYANHADKPYCVFVIQPKIEKVRKIFGQKLRKK